VFIFCLCTATSAQYRCDSWTTDDGLPQNSVHAILQTSDGYLWLTTLDGLVRFDGVRFTVFNKGNTPGINSNRFNSLCEAQDGTLWAGTEDGGITRYKDGKFVSLTTAEGLIHNGISAVQSAADGRILIATQGGLIYWKDGAFIPFEGRNALITSMQFYLGRSGALWMFEKDALYRNQHGVTNRHPFPIPYPTVFLSSCYEDSKGNLWFGINGFEGYYQFRDGRLSLYTKKDGWYDSPYAICEDRQGNLWFGGNGVKLFKEGRFTRFDEKDGLSSPHIRSLYEDSEGNIWAGTFGRGINRLTRQTIFTYTTQHGLDSDNVYPILEDSKGAIWIGADTLSRYRDGAFQSRAESARWPKGIQALYEDRQGRLWVGTYGGLYWGRDGHFTSFAPFFPLPLGFSIVQAINQTRDGALWFGTANGLVRMHGKEARVFSEKDGLASIDIKAIHEDRQGNLWVGTYGGLSLFKDGRFITYTTSDGLTSNRVRSIYEDSDGVLWIGTYDVGMNRFRDGRFVNYTTGTGLFSNGVFQILEDRRGYFWMSSNQGIHRVSRQQLDDYAEGKITAVNGTGYGESDGMANAECNGGRQPAGIKTRDGRLWFPTQKGVAVIDPEAVPFNPRPPPVVIESALIERSPCPLAPLRVEPGQGAIEIQYTGLSFIKPEQMRFKYMLEGLDADWTDAATRRYAYYSYLPPGNYTFKVIAANSDNVWNLAGASIRIIVVPPFYRTFWFISLMSIAGLAIVTLLYRARVARFRKEKLQQETFSRQLIESQEAERKRIAAEIHDSLSQSLVIIKNRAMLSLSREEEHDHAIEQMREIADAASHAIDEAREIIYDLRPIQLDRLGFTKAVEEMIEKLSLSQGLEISRELDEIEGILTKEAESSLYRIVQESFNNIIKHAGATRAGVSIKKSERGVELRVSDNGKGFAINAANFSGGFGLTGIIERARLLGGQPLIESKPGQGTTVSISLPARGEKDGR
jgi:signal transduction histidine kinase/ligand-binding sensor domain-containing protein